MKPAEHTAIHYPDSDGEPMSDNTLQYEWVVLLKENLDTLLQTAFVAGNILWYPVEGEPRTRRGPDVLVSLDRPKGYRGSYKQWEEGKPPEVVFEVLSPSNTVMEMARKFSFYTEHGVQELYLVDPFEEEVQAWHRRGTVLAEARWTRPDADDADSDPEPRLHSPLLGIRFVRRDGALVVLGPTGEPFRSFAEITAAAEAAQEQARQAQEQARQAQEQARAAQEQAQAAQERAARLAARLRELGIDPDQV